MSATYPLARYEDAIDHAADAGRRGAVKIAFDLAGKAPMTPSPPSVSQPIALWSAEVRQPDPS